MAGHLTEVERAQLRAAVRRLGIQRTAQLWGMAKQTLIKLVMGDPDFVCQQGSLALAREKLAATRPTHLVDLSTPGADGNPGPRAA